MERIDFSREENQLAAICNPEWHHAPLWKLECLSPTIVEVRERRGTQGAARKYYFYG